MAEGVIGVNISIASPASSLVAGEALAVCSEP